MHNWLAINKLPQIGSETAECLLDLEKPPGRIDGRQHVLSIADNTTIAQEGCHVLLIISSDFFGIQVSKRAAILCPLAQRCVPTRPCWGSFQDEGLEQAR